MTTVDDTPDEAWSITIAEGRAEIRLLRALDADDAFPLRNALADLTAGCASLVFDVGAALYIAHSAQVVIREECKTRPVAMRGITERLRRVLRTDSVQLLAAVIEEPAA
ncbi:MAG: hypothetical protein QOH79_1611 [Acidimicrobiaceae bacterium]|jgi:hypothetical protein